VGVILKNRSALISRLNAADRSYQGAQGRSFLYRSFAWVFGAVLLFFVLDVAFHLDARGRALLIAGFVAGVACLAAIAAYIWRGRRNRVEKVARLVETQEPQLGSKVINLLQLDEQTRDDKLPPITRQLAAQAVEDYDRDLNSVDFVAIARLPRLRNDLRKALAAIAVFALALALFPQISSVEIVRFADPYGDHPPYSFTQLTIADPSEKGVQVIYNKSTVVQVHYTGHQPKEVFLSFYDPAHSARTNSIEMLNKGKLGFWQQIDGIKSDLVIFAHTPDYRSISHKRRIGVILTPKLETAFVKVSPPAYTGLKPDENPFQFKEVRALQGSQVQFRLRSNRPLHDGIIEWRSASTDPVKIAMTPSGENEVRGILTAKDSGRMRFSMTDVQGIASEDLFESSLTVTHDLPPEISIAEPNKDSFVSMDFKMTAKIEASDDYGIKMIRIHRALNGVYSAPKTIAYDTIVRTANPTVEFNFKELGVEPGDVISIFAEAIDTAPEPNLTRSQTVNITLISEDDYNTFVREQHDISDIEAKYSELLNHLQDQIDEQKKLSEQIEALQKQMAGASDKDKASLQQQINRLVAKQSEINSKLGKTADEMENFVRKKPVYDIESEYQNILSQKAQDIKDSVAATDQAMKSVVKQKPGMDALSALKRASDEQAKNLATAQEQAREQIEKSSEDLSQMQQLMEDFNHFERLFETQESLAAQNRAYNSRGTLPREDQIALRQLAGTEKDVEDELRDLSKKLRDDAAAAKKKFPKAAQGGRDLADSIDAHRLPPLASEATDAMLNAEGEKSSALSERLRAEMEKMFSECQSQGKQQGEKDELDTYLKLQRSMNARNTFQQMRQSRKFGPGGQPTGEGRSMGKGEKGEGASGYVISDQPATDVLGGETSLSSGEAKTPSNSKIGRGQGEAKQSESPVSLEKAGALTGVKSVNRKSDAVTSEAPIDSYDEIVNSYFKAITK
jgi:hypothetical protein